MEQLASQSRDKLIDLLKERHFFECTGVKLYDRLLERLGVVPELEPERVTEYQAIAGRLRSIRDAEQAHAEWLEGQITSLGGNPRKKTQHAYLVEQESSGIADVILYTVSPIPAMFHALLAAELTDNAGWDLLVTLADQAGDVRAKAEFQSRLNEEQEHLRYVRELVARFAQRDVLPRPMEVAAPQHVPV